MTPSRIASYGLIFTGVVLLALNIVFGGKLNVALPLVFIMLGGLFIGLVTYLGGQRWAALLYLPGAVLAALGLVFLLNVLTADWTAWAYAWLLPVAALGLGLLLADHRLRWPRPVHLTAWGLLLGGLSLFVIFGAVTGGLLIQIMAPILLIAGGLLLWLARRRPALAAWFSARWSGTEPAPVTAVAPRPAASDLVEPLSARELEVLRLLDSGLSNQEIAFKLNVAPSTVKTHINNLYGKIGAQNRVQALNRARQLGLLDSDS
ncbi:MAG TPA: response regulator transcription factor [Anaerolineaceae bacterium]